MSKNRYYLPWGESVVIDSAIGVKRNPPEKRGSLSERFRLGADGQQTFRDDINQLVANERSTDHVVGVFAGKHARRTT